MNVVSVPLVAGELDPGLIMTFDVCFEASFQRSVFWAGLVPRHKCRTTISGELEREIWVILQEPE